MYSTENVKNHKYFGLEELSDLVSQNPSIFPHVYDIEIPFRMGLRFFEIFRNIWNILFPKTFGLASRLFLRENLRYLDMYYMFVNSNNISIKHSEFEDKLFGLSEEQCTELSFNFIQSLHELTDAELISNEEYKSILDLFRTESSKYASRIYD